MLTNEQLDKLYTMLIDKMSKANDPELYKQLARISADVFINGIALYQDMISEDHQQLEDDPMS